MEKLKITALIPVRAGSRRLPNKNILPFGDSNLLVHKIRQLKKVSNIDEIIVSSDSDKMLKMAEEEGVKTQKRPIEFCDEKTKTFNEVVDYIVSNIDTDIVVWAPCVCPLTQIDSYKDAIQKFTEVVLNQNEYDSLISAKMLKEYVFDEKGPLNWNPQKHIPSQQLPEWKIIVNGFYVARKEDMLKWRFVYGHKPYLYVLDKKEAVDIDDADDFEIAKALLGK